MFLMPVLSILINKGQIIQLSTRSRVIVGESLTWVDYDQTMIGPGSNKKKMRDQPRVIHLSSQPKPGDNYLKLAEYPN